MQEVAGCQLPVAEAAAAAVVVSNALLLLLLLLPLLLLLLLWLMLLPMQCCRLPAWLLTLLSAVDKRLMRLTFSERLAVPSASWLPLPLLPHSCCIIRHAALLLSFAYCKVNNIVTDNGLQQQRQLWAASSSYRQQCGRSIFSNKRQQQFVEY